MGRKIKSDSPNKMKVLFIYKYEYIEPLGILSLSAYLKKKGHKIYFIDLKFSRDYYEEIKKIMPDVIAYSITTGKHNFYKKLNIKLKKRFNFFAVFGGPHCTFFPEFIKEDGVDAISKGEGEFAFAELLDKFEKNEDIRFIKNVDIKINGVIYQNEVRNLIPDLDILPYPDRELINRYKHYRKMHRRYILTGRGCPYNCAYCFNHSYNRLYAGKGNIIRKRSVDSVIKELKEIEEGYKPKRFQFVDDTFILDRKWTLDFCKRYEEEIKLPFICYTRVNLVDEEIIKALKEAGCITVLFAIESGNDYIRNEVLKRNISEEQILNTAGLCSKYKLKTYIQNMVGLPDETLEKVWETIRLNIKCKPSYSWVSIFQPYPKTDLCDYSIAKGYYEKKEIDLFNESYYYKSLMNMKDIRKIERLHHLFPLAVEFPFLIPFIKLLTNFNLNRFYILLWNLHRAFCYFFRVKWIDFSELFIRK